MTRRFFAAAAATMVLGALLAPSASARRPPCRPFDSHTVLSNRYARVYKVFVGPSEIPEWFGCSYRQNRSYRLGVSIQRVRLVGRIVAYGQAGGSSVTFGVVNLRNGHRRNSSDIANEPDFDQPVATDLVLKPNGAIAWILTKVNGETSPPGSEVGRLDARGERTLAAANDIEAHSLRLRGSVLTWSQAGATVTSSLR